MPLQKLQFRPGVVRDVTGYTNEGGWFDCNLVRFRLGFPESIGGWVKSTTNQFLGIARSMLAWINLDLENFLALGTNLKYYVEKSGIFNDITPIRKTASLSNPFSATSGFKTITVADTAHGASQGDYVTFSGASSLGGNITAAVLNKEYSITTIVDADSYTITASVAANGSDTGKGSTVSAAYQVSTGLNTQVAGTGWGAGSWGRGQYGYGTTLSTSNTLRLWSQDNYGEDLIFNVVNGGIYYWYGGGSLATRGVALNSLSTDTSTPTLASQIMVSDRDRHVIAFGANMGTGTKQDPLNIRFSDGEDPFTWYPSATNSAGDQRIGSGTKIVRAVETKREIVVFTDIAVYSLQYLGPPYTFGIQPLANNITIIGYNAAVAIDDSVLWMGHSNFYAYAGQTAPLQCPVQSYVFNDFNLSQSDKVFAFVTAQYGEVTWLYPSASSQENDRYVTYNYIDKTWVYGQLARSAWIDDGVRPYPLATSPDGYLYIQEYGTDDGSQNPSVALNPYIESSPIDIGEGDKFSFVRRILPDVKFFNSSNSPEVSMVLKTQNYTGSNYVNGSTSAVDRTATVPVDQYTNVANVRVRGRSLILRIESNKVGTRWGLGSPRIEIRPDGGR
jgi:hypothetical protein